MKRKKGFSEVVGVLVMVVLVIAAIGVFYGFISSYLYRESGEAEVKSSLLLEGLEIRKAIIDPSNPSLVNLTICCASGFSKEIREAQVNQVSDIALVIDRSGSMRQSGWTMDIAENLSPLYEFKEVNVPRGAYSSEYTFNVDEGKGVLLASLDWGKISGINGSEASEFSLNLRRPSGAWIFGNSQPSVSGKVDPPDSVGAGNEYFSGISTKPQMVQIVNPESGVWRVRVYGWNLRPKINQPNSQNVNISVFYGSSNQLSRNPTVLSIDAAKNSSKNLINSKNESEYLSYIVFGSYAELKQPLTENRNLLISAIDNTGQEGGTAIDRGIAEAIQDFANNGREDSKKVMVILTDGQNDEGPEIVLEKAQEAKNENITIFTIGLTNFVDHEMLREVASEPNFYKYVPEASQLDFIFNEIREEIKKIYESNLLSDYFKVVFYNDESSYTYILKGETLRPLDVETFVIDLEGKLENPKKLEIYPVIVFRGKEVVGPLLGTYYLR